MSEHWRDVVAEADFPEAGRIVRIIEGWHVLVIRTDDGLFALNNRCTHQGSTLDPGRLRQGFIVCPLHGARFELTNGRCLGGEYPKLRTFPVRVEDGMISVILPDHTPSLEEVPAPLLG